MLTITLDYLYVYSPVGMPKKYADALSAAWAGHKNEKGNHILPFDKVIGLVDPKTAIWFLDRAGGPQSESLRVRYELCLRRIKSGQFSALYVARTDVDYFDRHINLIERAAKLLQSGIQGVDVSNEMKELWNEFADVGTRARSRYKFEAPLRSLLELICLDNHRFVSTSFLQFLNSANLHGTDRMFLEELYKRSFDCLHSLRDATVYTHPPKIKRRNTFIGGWLAVSDLARESSSKLHYAVVSQSEFEPAIKLDLIDVFGTNTTENC